MRCRRLGHPSVSEHEVDLSTPCSICCRRKCQCRSHCGSDQPVERALSCTLSQDTMAVDLDARGARSCQSDCWCVLQATSSHVDQMRALDLDYRKRAPHLRLDQIDPVNALSAGRFHGFSDRWPILRKLSSEYSVPWE